jgi:hypothetical protein
MQMTTIVRDLGVALPLLLVYVLGLCVALSQISTRPRVAAAAGTAFALLLLMQLVRPVVYAVLTRTINEFGPGPQIGLIYAGIGLMFNLVAAAGIAGLLFAIFADRPATAQQPTHAPWPQKPVV